MTLPLDLYYNMHTNFKSFCAKLSLNKLQMIIPPFKKIVLFIFSLSIFFFNSSQVDDARKEAQIKRKDRKARLKMNG